MPTPYTIDPVVSTFTVRAFAGGLLSAMGHNPVVAIPDFKGEVQFDPAAPMNAGLKLRINAASLSVRNDMSDKDRAEMERGMLEDVLEVARYPEIVFEGAGVPVSQNGNNRFEVQIQGNVTLHGVTRREVLPAQLILLGGMLRANGSFTLRQTDYRIKLASVAGGVLKLKDELQFSYDIVCRREVV